MVELLPYQREGVSWMLQRERTPDEYGIRGGIVGDDMGLGKTLTVLECVKQNLNGPTLIVCPLQVVSQWKAECLRIGIRPSVIEGRDGLYEPLHLIDTSVVIASHTCFTMRHMCIYSINLYQKPFYRLVVDEAHTLRKWTSLLSQNLCSFPAVVRWAVTGTPLIHVTIPPRSVNTPVEKSSDIVAYTLFLTNNRHDARDVAKDVDIHNIMLRRLKTDVSRPLIHVSTYTGCLSESETTRYHRYYDRGVSIVAQEHSADHLITIMLRLRQVCGAASWKFQTLHDHVAGHPSGTKVLVFCSFRDEIELAKRALEQMDVVMEFHGGVPLKEREHIMTTFRQPSYQSMAIVIQIECGGTGLNMEAAQHVYIMSPTWSPHLERQAIGRAQRMTTRHMVHIHRLVTQNSIESFMYRRQQTKDDVSKNLLGETTDDICGSLFDAQGLTPTFWSELCDIDTLFEI